MSNLEADRHCEGAKRPKQSLSCRQTGQRLLRRTDRTAPQYQAPDRRSDKRRPRLRQKTDGSVLWRKRTVAGPRNDVREKIQALPQTPGVYLFKGKRDELLYIGKARDLRARVLSYFRDRTHSPKIAVLLGRISDVDVIETQTEVDALLLEAQLVRKHEPKYNTQLKDDKSYPLLKLSGDRFPRLVVTRNKSDRKATYYGPYTDAKLLREAVRIINSLFPIRKCQTLPKRACLYYHIGQCVAPCIKPEVKPRYDWLIDEIKSFLKGGRKSLIDYLTERMKKAASEYRFEDAQFFKDQIEALGWFRKKRFHLKHPEGGIGLRGTMELKQALHLERLPEKIVCFDVSNIQGSEAVASKVCFYRELSNPMEYRRYKIKTVSGIDDYAMIAEAVRRMVRGIKEGRESAMPDLILIDGGRGHLNAAKEVLDSERCSEVEVISIAKRFEFVFTPKMKDPVVFPPDSSALRLLQKIRDEAHRFAIAYHRRLREKKLTRSLLDQVEGIGGKRKRLLLRSFQSLDELRNTPLDILARMEGMNRTAAERVLTCLQNSCEL
ncbi:MAG: excinuclease ABC subunit UvrC [Candidatus Omnitrophica bacterium]|nr:excinuclease ABC subunit UvrC [Candidatus Omnitrophota bacterium]